MAEFNTSDPLVLDEPNVHKVVWWAERTVVAVNRDARPALIGYHIDNRPDERGLPPLPSRVFEDNGIVDPEA